MNDSKRPIDRVADMLRAQLPDVPIQIDGTLTATDGTEWVYSPGLDLWTGWVPGEDGSWMMTRDEVAERYPELEPRPRPNLPDPFRKSTAP